MSTIAPAAPAIVAFPKSTILQALKAELLDVAQSEAMVRNIAYPKQEHERLRCAIPMDSLTAVDALCVLDGVVGFKLKDQIVRTGGYSSVEAALEHMMPRIERAWVEKQKKKKVVTP